MITQRQIDFRQEYRSRILGWYDGYFHIVLIYAMGAAAFGVFCLRQRLWMRGVEFRGERVTRGEILDALAAPIPAVDLDGLRRRTRALMGRCQGFFCGAHVTALLANRGAASGTVSDAP